MRVTYPKGEQSKSIFMTEFLIGAGEPDHLGLVSSSLITDMQLTQSAFETAKATKNQHLGKRIQLVAEHEAATRELKNLISQAVSTLKHQIRKGIYPKTVLAYFEIPMSRYKLPTRQAEILETGKRLIEGDNQLTTEGYPRLNSPRATEIQQTVDRVVALKEELTASRNNLSQARDSLKVQHETVERLHRKGSKELDLNTLDKTHTAIRDLKRNFGYRYISLPSQEEPTTEDTGGATQEEPTTEDTTGGATQEETPTQEG